MGKTVLRRLGLHTNEKIYAHMRQLRLATQ